MQMEAFLAAAERFLSPMRLVSRDDVTVPFARKNDEAIGAVMRSVTTAPRPRVAMLNVYDPQYTRTQSLLGILRRNGYQTDLLSFPGRPLRLFWEILRKRNVYDVFLLTFRGQEWMPFVRFLLRGRPLIFDAFLGIAETLVDDRKKVRPQSLAARFFLWLDRWLCRLSDHVLVDTQTHADFFSRELQCSHVTAIYVECDEALFPHSPPRPKPSDVRNVLWYGTAQPLHALDRILRLATHLEKENVQFTLIGPIVSGRSNVHTIPWVKSEDLASFIDAADLCLAGPFGDSTKARRIITGKTYQILARGAWMLIGDTVATREIFLSRRSP